ncbi:WapI family immunity protein [Dactylosporangium sp. CA-092794]|uniref:WapI family immunity protein n=1 Tax=Dactylosporangium sp. CA-092794 TaxID=3239929 RepID=UPI003D90FC7F
MKLRSRTGASVELRAAAGEADGRLTVEGVVDALDGRAWSFRAACLTGGEARRLGEWLLRAAKGRAEPQARLTFPVLSFTLDEHDYGQPRLVVGFSGETAPAWLGEERERTFDYPVTLDLTPESLEAAAVDWDHEINRSRS